MFPQKFTPITVKQFVKSGKNEKKVKEYLTTINENNRLARFPKQKQFYLLFFIEFCIFLAGSITFILAKRKFGKMRKQKKVEKTN